MAALKDPSIVSMKDNCYVYKIQPSSNNEFIFTLHIAAVSRFATFLSQNCKF